MKKAILFGASGFIGSHLLNNLLANPAYDRVTIVVRKPVTVKHPKLVTLIGDYHSLPSLKDQLVADDVFITLGTTQKKTPDAKEYYQVDHDYPVLATRLTRDNGATSVFMVTAIGANPNSKVTYIKTKGEAERDVIALGMEHVHIFRPSMILGKRKEKRPMERVLIGLWRVINPLLIGGLNRYKGMDARNIAKAMNNAAGKEAGRLKIYQWKEMRELL